MASAIRLEIHEADASQEQLAVLNRELSQWIQETVPGCEVEPESRGAAPPGAKGLELAAIAGIALALIESGAVTALIQSLATYIKQRRPEISLSVQTPDGGRIELDAKNLGQEQLKALVDRLR